MKKHMSKSLSLEKGSMSLLSLENYMCSNQELLQGINNYRKIHMLISKNLFMEESHEQYRHTHINKVLAPHTHIHPYMHTYRLIGIRT